MARATSQAGERYMIFLPMHLFLSTPGPPAVGRFYVGIIMNKIACLTDFHLDDILSKKYCIDSRRNLEKILFDIKQNNIDTIILTGDYGNRNSLIWLNQICRTYFLNTYYELGNHDKLKDLLSNRMIDEKYISNGKLDYVIKNKKIDLIFLDSSKKEIDGTQYVWLEKCISESDKYLYLFTHYPIFDCGNSALDRAFPLLHREKIQDLLLSLRKKIRIFCGHYHFRYDQKIGLIEQYVNPAVIMQVKCEGDKIETDSFRCGYRIIDLEKGENEVVMMEGNKK
jgi:3',5'-cyclic-AMP phosphodiesterase